MASASPDMVRTQLLERRDVLQRTIASPAAGDEIARLLVEVDAALERITTGTWGLCETCHDPIEPELLDADPLVRSCIGDLSEAQRRELEKDLEVAGRIQRGLLPETSMAIGEWTLDAHFAPAGPVSGDFCEVIRPTNCRDPLLIIGDVSGKGVAAGMLSTQLSAIFRSLVDDPVPLGSLLERANRIFRSTAVTAHFATLLAIRIGEGGSLELANAGHCLPLMLSRSGVTTLEPTGLPIGTFLSAHYTAHRLTLDPGEALLLHTDGLTEARDGDDAEYGTTRLETLAATVRHLTAASLLAAVVTDVDRHRAGRPRHDDLTLALLRRCA
jgi:phosphoserine phosphatase RsbU/P